LTAVVAAGVNFFRVGPAYRQWKLSDIAAVEAWDRAAVFRGAHTIISLNTLSAAKPDSRDSGLLWKIVTSLTSDRFSRGIGLWKGADEPLKAGVPASALRFAYWRVTSRGERSWCAGKTPLDPAHLWLTIQAPRGSAAALAPYSKVTDSDGVDVYPVSTTTLAPKLHQVGIRRHTLASITPDQSTWTTLQICVGRNRRHDFVLPSTHQERYMIYDAIINGARGLAFFGGDNPRCWNPGDRTHHWNWTFWSRTLKRLIQQINAHSLLAPALIDPDSTHQLTATDPTTEAISRNTNGDLWIIAARHGNATKNVTISGLPKTITTATVYTEHRQITIKHGTLTDTFHQWQVHVYYLRLGNHLAEVGAACLETAHCGPPPRLESVRCLRAQFSLCRP